MMRVMLYEAAQHASSFDKMVLAHGLGDEDRQEPRDEKKIVTPARRLAVTMYRIWVYGTEFRWTKEVTAA